MKQYIVGVDIGRKRDRYTEVVLKDEPGFIDGIAELGQADRLVHRYSIVWLKRALNFTYSQMIDSTMKLLGHSDLVNNHELLVDGTGVGDAVVEGLRARGAQPIPIVFTAGEQVREVPLQTGRRFAGGDTAFELMPIQTLKQINVPKADLVAAGQLLLEQRRVGLAEDLPADEKKAFLQQMQGFRGIRNERTGNIKYEAETEDIHDDYVTAFLMVAWWCLKKRSQMAEREIIPDHDKALDWEPMELLVNGVTNG